MKILVKNPQEVVKEALWLAWKAGHVMGMGVLQMNPGATKEDVWNHETMSPLGSDIVIGGTGPGRLRADYVFGKMMKLTIEWDSEGVTVPDSVPRSDYQSWSYKYPTYERLIKEAVNNLENQPVG